LYLRVGNVFNLSNSSSVCSISISWWLFCICCTILDLFSNVFILEQQVFAQTVYTTPIYLISPFIYNSSFLLVKFPISYQIELAHVDVQLCDFVVDNFVVCPDRVDLLLHPVNFILSVLDRVLVRTLDHVHLRLERNRLFLVFAFQIELNLFGQLQQ
jgi:hypothetical protein